MTGSLQGSWLAVPYPERACKALRSNGEPCKRWAIRGADVCSTHGGSLKRVKAAAQRRLAAQRATEDLAQMGMAVDTTAPEALEEMLAESAGMVVALRDKINELASMTTGDAKVFLSRYDAERDRLQRYAKDFAVLGLAERKQALRESEIDQLYQAMVRSLDELPQAQRLAVEARLRSELRGLMAIEATASSS